MALKKNDINNLEHIEKVLSDPENRYYLWGTGETGEAFYNEFHDKINIVGFIDSFTEDGETKFGLPVRRFEQVELAGTDKVIVTIRTPSHVAAVKESLERAGLRICQEYFQYLMAARVVRFLVDNRIDLEQHDLIITSHCTYRCKECIQLIPYVSNPHHYKTTEIKKNIDTSFTYVDFYREYHIVGGEPLLHPELREIVSYIGNNYGDKVGVIVVVTNGTLIPGVEELRAMADWKVRVEISDYRNSKTAPKGQKITELTELLTGCGIDWKLRPMETWWGYSGSQGSGISEEGLIECLDSCPCGKFTLVFTQNQAYLCSRSYGAEDAELVPSGQGNSLALEGPVDAVRRKLLEFSMGITETGYLPYCRACYSQTPIYLREIPAAEQIISDK